MPAGTSAMVALANITLSSTVSSVSFSSISGSYRDLVLVVNANIVSGSYQMFYRFNGDSGSNYNIVYMGGTGSPTPASGSSSSQAQIYAAPGAYNDLTTINEIAILNLMDYSATDKHKTALIRTNNTNVAVIATAARWSNTAAVTSLTVGTSGSTFITGTTMALYGVSA